MMPTVIRKKSPHDATCEIELSQTSWNLCAQVETLGHWLRSMSSDFDTAHPRVADIGFVARGDAIGGGPVISLELMKMCIGANLEIWFSEYPGTDCTQSDSVATRTENLEDPDLLSDLKHARTAGKNN